MPPAAEPHTTMASDLEHIAIEHLPPGYDVYAVLVTNVENAAFLQAQLVARNPEFEYALIDASTILSRTHLLAAVYKATWAHANGSLKTPNVHSETVLSLSPTMNIAEAYRRYGISLDTKDVIVIKVLAGDNRTAVSAVWAHVAANVKGSTCPLTNEKLNSMADMAKVKKYFKLNNVPSLAGHDATPQNRSETEMLVLGAMALRGL